MQGRHLGLLLSFLAGICTTAGSFIIFCMSVNRALPFALCMAASAGVMMYVSFVDLFAASYTDTVQGMVNRGYSDTAADKWGYFITTACFFVGWVATNLIDLASHLLMECYPDGEKETNKGCDCEALPQKTARGHIHDAGVRAVEPATCCNCDCHRKHEAHDHEEDRERLAIEDKSENDSDVISVLEKRENTAATAASEEDSATTSGKRSKVVQYLANWFSHQPNAEEKELMEEAERRFVSEHNKVIRLGILTAIALAIHNFPEGVATFTSALLSPTFGAGVAFAVGVHNIPEGFAVAVPIYFGTGSAWKALIYSFLSGIAEPIGAIIAFLAIGDNTDPLLFGILFGLIAGVMTNIALKELYPTALRYDPVDRCSSLCFFLAMVFMATSLVAFKFTGHE